MVGMVLCTSVDSPRPVGRSRGLPLTRPISETDVRDAADVRSISERFEQPAETPDFQRHVAPLLGRLGCNGRACHGSFQGQGGFRLSLFGYDFSADHEALTEGRVNLLQPRQQPCLDQADERRKSRRWSPLRGRQLAI